MNVNPTTTGIVPCKNTVIVNEKSINFEINAFINEIVLLFNDKINRHTYDILLKKLKSKLKPQLNIKYM